MQHIQRSSPRPQHEGFSLFELSVVVVIIALLAGLVVMGKSMIRTSQLQTIAGEYDSYLKSIREFQDKYQALPGDMSNAEATWDAYATCGTYTATIPTNTNTCDGNGDGRIGSSATNGTSSNENEWFGAWQHLSNAGLIDGRYTGQRGNASGSHAMIGKNVPASKFPRAGWTLRYYLNTATTATMWGDQYGHILDFGMGSTSGPTYDGVMTSTEALGLDQKMDDGKPGTGKMRAWRTSRLSTCTSNDGSNDQSAVTYNSTDTVNSCSFIFLLGF